MDKKDQFKIITLKVLLDFIVENKIDVTCRLCGHSNLSVPQIQIASDTPGESNFSQRVNIFKNNSLYSDSADMYYISLICNKCGNTLHIDADTVFLWVNQNTIPNTGDEKNGK
ncbi:hypothetical protein ACYUM6_001097 [Enterobacter hormaechei]|uniref:hypothetical protein n=1 Tax=Enterobacter hormaechei TaxID=158836 RepID=UPI000D529B41|nr:hypothetical protein [Enterobacter hormaechei]